MALEGHGRWRNLFRVRCAFLFCFSSCHGTAAKGTCMWTSISVLPALCIQSTPCLWAHSPRPSLVAISLPSRTQPLRLAPTLLVSRLLGSDSFTRQPASLCPPSPGRVVFCWSGAWAQPGLGSQHTSYHITCFPANLNPSLKERAPFQFEYSLEPFPPSQFLPC